MYLLRSLMPLLCLVLSSCSYMLQRSVVPGTHQLVETVKPEYILRIKGLGSEEKVVALTIDDAPSDKTGALLDQLKAHQATATFFIHGDRITPENQSLIRRMLAEGHELGNHMPESYPSRSLPPSIFQRQFLRNHEILASLGAQPVRFRPSHGVGNDDMKDFLSSQKIQGLGYRPAFYLATNYCWDIGKYAISPQCYAHYITTALRPGRILIFHDNQDLPSSKAISHPHGAIDQTQRTLNALPTLFARLSAEGYTARSLAEVEALATRSPR